MAYLILFVESGALSGTKLVIAPGGSVLVGRDEEADISLPRDGAVSRKHCKIEWDGARGIVRDLSLSGTKVDGQAIEGEASIGHAGFVQVGETLFCSYVEDHTPPRAEPAKGARAAAAERALQVLSAERGLYALLDAARSERVLELLRESVDPHQCLYDGNSARSLGDVAPYLVRIASGSRLLPKLVREGWSEGWGVFMTSAEPFRAVRKHFRRFLIVQDERTTKPMYFRFYDPRVLREFMPLASTRQKAELFGEADALSSLMFEDESMGLVRVDAPASTRATSTGEALVPNP